MTASDAHGPLLARVVKNHRDIASALRRRADDLAIQAAELRLQADEEDRAANYLLKPKGDKTTYMREYMRNRRAKLRQERDRIIADAEMQK